MDPRTALKLAGQGVTGSYEVLDDPATSGPVLDITVVANNKSAVEQTLRAVTSEVTTKLNELQGNMKPQDKITSLVISFDPEPNLYTSKKVRPMVVVFGLGLVLSVAIVLAVDTAIIRRQARRHSGNSKTAPYSDPDRRRARRQSGNSKTAPYSDPDVRELSSRK
jgi:hypothetical protein